MSTEAPPRFLLLVPPPTGEANLASFKNDYDETTSEVLKEVSLHSESSTGAAVLEIAFALPHLVGSTRQRRSALYLETQRHLALLYKLVVLIAARESINVEDDAGVDVRVIPLAWSPTHADAQGSYVAPVVDIFALAKSNRVWQYAFGVESEAGEAMVAAFVSAKAQTHDRSTGARSALVQVENANHHVAVGGTFDHLHIGHKLLLTMTLFTADVAPGSSITIGLTGDELLKNKKYAEVLETWEDREQAIEDFCDSLLDFSSWPSTKARKIRDEAVANGRSTDLHYSTGVVVRCTQIQDPFGPTITEEAISAIVLSAETRAGGEAINKKRSEQGWAPLTVFEVDVLDAEAEGVSKEGFDAKLSSTAIRQRLVSEGNTVYHPLYKTPPRNVIDGRLTFENSERGSREEAFATGDKPSSNSVGEPLMEDFLAGLHFQDDLQPRHLSAKQIEKQRSYFSEMTEFDWVVADRPNSIIDALELRRAFSRRSLRSYLRHRFSQTRKVWLGMPAAFMTFYGNITSLQTDFTLVITHMTIAEVCFLYRRCTMPLLDVESARRMHTSHRERMLWNTQLITYFLVKVALTIYNTYTISTLSFPAHASDRLQAILSTMLALLGTAIYVQPHFLYTRTKSMLKDKLVELHEAVLETAEICVRHSVWICRVFGHLSLSCESRYWRVDEFRHNILGLDEIRLLQLSRKLPFCGVRASMLVVKLNDSPNYEAISYTWGDCMERCEILIDGQRYSTTHKAREALDMHRSFWRPKIVWIDQICINQDDDIEKGQQVAKMYDIYSRADRVVVNLGSSHTAGAAVSMLSALMSDELEHSHLAEFMFVFGSANNYTAIVQLLQHPWFSRVWVIQEVAAAKEIVVVYGGFMVDWQSMAIAFRTLVLPGIRDGLSAHRPLVDTVRRSLDNVSEMMEIRHSLYTAPSPHKVSLPQIVAQTAGYMATDMRDKIFALQSISKPFCRPNSTPVHLAYNYTHSIEWLYTELALTTLYYSPDPYYLMRCAGTSKRGRLDLPSWIPDWTSPSIGKDKFNHKIDGVNPPFVDVTDQGFRSAEERESCPVVKRGRYYRASGGTKPVYRIQTHNVLVHGVLVGSVDRVSLGEALAPEDCELYDGDKRSAQAYKIRSTAAWYREAKDLVADVYDSPSAGLEVFWRSMIGDCWHKRRPASTKAVKAYEAYISALEDAQDYYDKLDRGEVNVHQPDHVLSGLILDPRTTIEEWLGTVNYCAMNRSFYTIAGRYVGVVPHNTDHGDVVVIALGATVPWVLRPIQSAEQEDGRKYLFVGECYVHGLMDSEFVNRNMVAGSKLWWKRHEKPRRKRERPADYADMPPKPAWVELLEEAGCFDDADEEYIADLQRQCKLEDILHENQTGRVFVPGCEWFTLC